MQVLRSAERRASTRGMYNGNVVLNASMIITSLNKLRFVINPSTVDRLLISPYHHPQIPTEQIAAVCEDVHDDTGPEYTYM